MKKLYPILQKYKVMKKISVLDPDMFDSFRPAGFGSVSFRPAGSESVP